MPSQDAWGLALQFLPAYLANPSAKLHERHPDLYLREGRDLLALVLARKPHSPEAYHAHSEATKLLLRRALYSSQDFGALMQALGRESVALRYVYVSDDVFERTLSKRPRRRVGLFSRADWPAIFWPAPALGETEEEATENAWRARDSAIWQRRRAQMRSDDEGNW